MSLRRVGLWGILFLLTSSVLDASMLVIRALVLGIVTFVGAMLVEPRRRSTVTVWAVAFLILLVGSASAAPTYRIVPLGLDDIEHTRNDGYKLSDANELNDAGQVAGYSSRYNGGSIDFGQSAWLYDGATTIDIGLTGPEHARNDGYKVAYASQLNEAGQVLGYSWRYNGGSADWGLSAWLYNGATTIDVGLTGPEHTRSDGHKFTTPSQLNEAGQVTGFSDRYIGIADSGHTAWLYNGATTIEIGLTGPEHTRNDGYKESYPVDLNEAGQVAGYSNRYQSGSFPIARSAWIYNGATTIDISLTGIEYTRSNGHRFSTARQLNEAGQVTGQSTRFNSGGTDLGDTAWLYNGATTIDIGLTGPEHTRTSGHKNSVPLGLNEAGQVIGESDRYNGFAELGNSAWLYDGATTIDVGLTGSEHTRSDGYKYSRARELNEAGQVIGSSNRYGAGFADLGYSAWLYNGATTIELGLTGPEHTYSDGFGSYKSSDALQLNEAGQVIGTSIRFNGGGGGDAWFYDPLSDQTFSLQLSVRSDGVAASNPRYLGEDGLVLGTYTLFDALDNELGERAFYFTVADGLHDLGSLIDGGLTANDWDYLARAIRGNGLGKILGSGMRTSQSGSQMAYLLTPVPEPSSTLSLAVTVCVFLALIRRDRGVSYAARPENFLGRSHAVHSSKTFRSFCCVSRLCFPYQNCARPIHQ
jgi:hypothetical protein